MLTRISSAFLVLSLALAQFASAEVRLPSVFGDHMVLQADGPAPIWGTAEPGEKVQVAIAGQSAAGRADKDGRWVAQLNGLKAGGPHTLTIRGRSELRTIHDVLIGEVWVCSGQSNMQWSVRQSGNADEEIAGANQPQLRLFHLERETAETPKEDCKGEWTECTPKTVPNFSAVAYFFGREVQKLRGVPVGLVHTSWGGTAAEAWTSRPALEAHPNLEPILSRWDAIVAAYPGELAKYETDHAAWEQARDAAKASGAEVPREPRRPQGPADPNRPANLYNAMIAPIEGYGIRGAIWYQGESNASRAYQYRELLPLMIADWRDRWDQGQFPFLIVQLANFMERKDTPGDSSWAELREAQSMTAAQPGNGLAVTIDIGEAGDIHPKNKQDVGRRLAYSAERVAYGNKKFASSGPTYRTHRVSGGEIVIEFDHVHDGLEARGGALKAFAIAGDDYNFVWADARIDGERVIVSSPSVAAPVAVRYGWADNPECTLYNGAGLPASPFRTDSRPGVTMENK